MRAQANCLTLYRISRAASSSNGESEKSPETANVGADAIKPLRIALKWRRISDNAEETIIGSSHDIEGEGMMVEHDEASEEDEFTRRVLGDDQMSFGSEEHGESSTSPVLLSSSRRSLLDDDEDDGADVVSSDEDDDDVVDLIKESMPPSELHSLHLSDDDLEDAAADDDDIDSEDEGDIPSVLPLRIVKSPQAVAVSPNAAAAGADAVEEVVDIITLDKIDEQLTDPTIVTSSD
ncbi:hypothetical protein ABW21_db0201390 [Orbilia brochopaga]|nr:hypothetical protein ABW21_db0201390 [Drechslerella brochopaga]